MRVTKASIELAKRFETRGRQRDCSRETGIGQSRLSEIANGKRFPRADEGAALQRSDGIEIDWWAVPLGQTDSEPDAQTDQPAEGSAAQ